MLTNLGGKTVYTVPKVVAINDMSGVGRCSLTIAIPVLSVMGVQCCPLPTAILSRHTGFESFYFKDLTDILPDYIANWKESNIDFEAIYSGFLGSFEQIKITEDFINSYEKKPLCVVDTVMGDNGKIYATYTKKMCDEMKRLVSLADVVTPNVTEACYLAGTEYTGENISLEKAEIIAKKLCNMGAKAVVITGIESGSSLVNFVYENDMAFPVYIPKSKKVFAGTGDLFASVLTGALTKGNSLITATKISSQFIYDCLEYTIEKNAPVAEGVLFEPLLYKLGGDTYGE